jgi:hypothetical protein
LKVVHVVTKTVRWNAILYHLPRALTKEKAFIGCISPTGWIPGLSRSFALTIRGNWITSIRSTYVNNSTIRALKGHIGRGDVSAAMEKQSPLLEDRRKKAEELKAMGVTLYPAGYHCDLAISEALEQFGGLDAEALDQDKSAYAIAGRILSIRDFGKASFIHISDRTGRIQAYIRKDGVGDKGYKIFKLMDMGSFFPHPDRGINHSRQRDHPPIQVHETPAGEMAWLERRGDKVQTAVSGPYRQRPGQGGFRPQKPHHPCYQGVLCHEGIS